MINANTILHTNGKGLWSASTKPVCVVGYELGYINEEADFGELKVYFDEATWDVETDGLIYTDDQFLSELLAFLSNGGFNSIDVSYSEQGMQGYDYVSLDVGEHFIASYFKNQAA